MKLDDTDQETELSPHELKSYINYRSRQARFWRDESGAQEKLKNGNYVTREVIKTGLTALACLGLLISDIYLICKLSKDSSSHHEYSHFYEDGGKRK